MEVLCLRLGLLRASSRSTHRRRRANISGRGTLYSSVLGRNCRGSRESSGLNEQGDNWYALNQLAKRSYTTYLRLMRGLFHFDLYYSSTDEPLPKLHQGLFSETERLPLKTAGCLPASALAALPLKTKAKTD